MTPYASLLILQIFVKNQRGNVLLLSFYGRIENKNVCSILGKYSKIFMSEGRVQQVKELLKTVGFVVIFTLFLLLLRQYVFTL